MTVPLSGGQNPAYVRLLFFSFSARRRRSVKNDRRNFVVGWERGVGKFRVYCDLFLETNEISRYNRERLEFAATVNRERSRRFEYFNETNKNDGKRVLDERSTL